MRCKTLFLEGILSSFLCNVREGETQRVYNRIICQYYIYIYILLYYGNQREIESESEERDECGEGGRERDLR